MRSVKKKYHLWKKYTWTKQYQDYLIYVQARNAATRDVRRAKRDFEKKLAGDIKLNPKSFWKYVRSKTKVKTGISDLEKDDGTFAHTDIDKAEVLNNFFSSVFTREDISDIPEPGRTYDGETLEAFQVTKDDVIKKLIKLNPCKSPGPDSIHPRVMKETAEAVSHPLTIIFNKSLQEGKVPDDWKIAHVTAIFKKGKHTSPGNYRPVSLTSIICKLLESIIRDRLMEFLDARSLLSEDQHGFRSGRSCVTQLLEIIEIWSSMLDEGGSIDVVYLDFRKAFDSVPHQRLLKKAEAYGIRGKLLLWIESFLTGRKQRVIVNGGKSTWADVVSGIPQGSVLGPILFLIFIDDLPDSIEGLVKIFADDTKVFSAIHDEEDSKSLQKDLDSLSEWSDKWQLRFNVSKCGVMYYGNRSEKCTYSMEEGGVRRDLGELTEEKDLGVTFDPTLTFSRHVGIIVNKANRILGVIKRSFTYMDADMFNVLYKTLVRPHLEYANCIWNPILHKDVKLIESVQRRATKIVPEMKDLPYSDRLQRLKIPTLAYRRLRGDMIQVFKLMHGFVDVKKEKIFVMADPERGTRGNSLKLQKCHARLRIRENAFSNRVVNSWNKLPDEVVLAKTVNMFKNGVDIALSKDTCKYSYGLGSKWLQEMVKKDSASSDALI